MITNDGTPIDFYISCGRGKAKATIAGVRLCCFAILLLIIFLLQVEYVNNDEEGETKWFYQVPVTRSADIGDTAV